MQIITFNQNPDSSGLTYVVSYGLTKSTIENNESSKESNIETLKKKSQNEANLFFLNAKDADEAEDLLNGD